jgi:ABC-type bacteriocin/lantibiotic exporter with double-glycine peptidase domain
LGYSFHPGTGGKSYCGAACLATVAKQYGLKVPITRIRQIAGTDQKGTNALGLIKAANQLCFIAKGIRLTPAELLNASDLPLPLIAHVVKDRLLHFVVIHQIGKKRIIIADPAEGLVFYKPEDFLRIWPGIIITLLPDHKFEKGDQTIGLFKRFFYIVMPHKRLLGEIILASIILTVFGLSSTFYWKYLIDEIMPDGLANTLHIISLGMLTLGVFHIILVILRGQLLLYFATKIDIKMMMDYFQHVMDLPMPFLIHEK